MRFDVVNQDLKYVTLVQDFKTLICMNSVTYSIFRLQNDKYVTDTANQVNHFQNFIAKVSKIMSILNFSKNKIT